MIPYFLFPSFTSDFKLRSGVGLPDWRIKFFSLIVLLSKDRTDKFPIIQPHTDKMIVHSVSQFARCVFALASDYKGDNEHARTQRYAALLYNRL